MINLKFVYLDPANCDEEILVCHDGPDDTADTLFYYCGTDSPSDDKVISAGRYVYCYYRSQGKTEENRGVKILYSSHTKGIRFITKVYNQNKKC